LDDLRLSLPDIALRGSRELRTHVGGGSGGNIGVGCGEYYINALQKQAI
jgi:hypothetical protein